LTLTGALKAVIQYSASGVKISSTSLEKKEKSADVALPKSFNLRSVSAVSAEPHVNLDSIALLQK
jgi:hypothetical protein